MDTWHKTLLLGTAEINLEQLQTLLNMFGNEYVDIPTNLFPAPLRGQQEDMAGMISLMSSLLLRSRRMLSAVERSLKP